MSIEDQMHIIGIVLGWIIFAGYLWLVMNYFRQTIRQPSAWAANARGNTQPCICAAVHSDDYCASSADGANSCRFFHHRGNHR